MTCFLQSVYTLRGKPASNTTLNIKSCLLALFEPHCATKVSLWVNNLVISSVNVKTGLFHLTSLFTHHMGRLCFVLVCLHLTFIFVWVIVSDLVCLRKGVVVSNATSVVTEPSKVRFGTLLLFNIDSNNFDLVV